MLHGNGRPKQSRSKPLLSFLFQTVFGTAFTYLTSGVILSGLAIFMGAGDVLVSYLSVIINICGVLILAFSPVLQRFRSRKRLAMVLTGLSKLATLFLVAIPAIVPADSRLIVFIPAVVVAFTLQAQTTVVLNQWMVGFVDDKKSGRYVSLRQTLTLTVTVLLSLVCGVWMDETAGQYRGFVILFAAAAVMGLCEVGLLARIPDSAAPASCVPTVPLRDIVRLPLQNRPYRGFVLYIFLFYLLLNISDSFTMVFMLKYLALPYRTVTMLYMIISLPQIFLLGIWGTICDKWGHSFALRASIWLFVGETLCLFLASPQTWFICIPLAFLAASVGNAGFVTAVFNRRYELMPQNNRLVFDNFYTAAIGLGFMIGPMIGGMLKSGMESSPAVGAALPLAGIRFLYLISAGGILLLQIGYAYMLKKKSIHNHLGCAHSCSCR